MNKALKKYLDRGVEPNTDLAMEQSWDRVVVIPAYNEGERIGKVLDQIDSQPGKNLAIVVINRPPNASEEVLQRNADTLEITQAFSSAFSVQSIVRHGVGEARKIGADIAFTLWCKKRIESEYFLTTDADVSVGNEFFKLADEAFAKEGLAAFHHDYTHLPADENERAIAEYEAHLRFYTYGLAQAGSPYAHPAIGSCLAISFQAYAEVRGFPKRQAGEDFHMLAKLAKVGRIRRGTVPQVFPSARISERVPFGTGRAMQKPQQKTYDPKIYEELKIELGGKEERAFHTQFDALKTLKRIHLFRDEEFPSVSVLEAAKAFGFKGDDDAIKICEFAGALERSLPVYSGLF